MRTFKLRNNVIVEESDRKNQRYNSGFPEWVKVIDLGDATDNEITELKDCDMDLCLAFCGGMPRGGAWGEMFDMVDELSV